MAKRTFERGSYASLFSSSDDQISFSLSSNRPGNCSTSDSGLQFGLQPSRFHTAPTFYADCAPSVSEDRLSRLDSNADRLVRHSQSLETGETSALFHALLCRKTVAKKNSFDNLLKVIFQQARETNLINKKAQLIVDATGMESRHVSRYYVWRSGYRRFGRRQWPKLTVACHAESHLFPGAFVSWGPSQDSPQFTPVMIQAASHARWDRVLGDAAYDSEANHVLCRKTLGIRSTVIPARRRNSLKWPTAKYRRQMKKRFFRHIYGQRWQVESAFSRHKRLLGSALRARTWASQQNECLLRVLTHNLMILLCVFSIR